MEKLLAALKQGHSVSTLEAREAFADFFDPKIPEASLKSWLLELSELPISAALLTGAAQILRERMETVALPADLNPIDTSGTGGDGRHSFNYSTAAALVVAAAGTPVAKHGNRSVSSRSGSADFLEALGIPIELAPEAAVGQLSRHGFAFFWAPRYHPAMARVQPLRRELGRVTVFNLLGPLLNPARVKRQIVGVFAPPYLNVLAEALKNLGSEAAWVVHSADGMDELSAQQNNLIVELKNSELKSWTLAWPGLPEVEATPSGKSAREHAELFLDLSRGGRAHPVVPGILLNAAAGLQLAGRVPEIQSGYRLAESTLRSGAVFELIRKLSA